METAHKPTALVVEDGNVTARIAASQLEAAGYAVTVAKDFVELEKLKAKEFDVIFLDMMMPGRSKLDLFDWVRAHFHGPINVVTGLTDKHLAREVSQRGAAGFWSKVAGPVPWAKLANDAIAFQKKFASLMI